MHLKSQRITTEFEGRKEGGEEEEFTRKLVFIFRWWWCYIKDGWLTSPSSVFIVCVYLPFLALILRR